MLFLSFVCNLCTSGNKTSDSIYNLKKNKYSSDKYTIDSISVDIDVDVYVDKKNSRGYTRLYRAVRSNDIERARDLLSSGADPNIDMLYSSILEKAVSNKNVEMVKLLLSHGANIMVKEDGSSTILDCFCHKSDDTSKEIYELLFKSLSYEERDRVNKNKKDKGLQECKEDINKVDSMGYTSLHWAVVDNNLEEVKRLLELGSDPNINDQKDDLLYSAFLKKNVEMVKLLLSHGTKVVFSENGCSKVLDDFRFNKDDISKEIYGLLISNLPDQEKNKYINSVDNLGYTPLYWAVQKNNLEEVKNLLELGSNPNVVVHGNRTPLYIAVQNQNKEIVRLLLSHGAEVYCCDEKSDPSVMRYNMELMDIILTHLTDSGKKDLDGLSPIHWACRDGRLSLVKYILNKDSSLINDSNNLYRFTPLHWAARGGFKDMVSFLISKGANKTAKSRSYFTPLMLAISNSHETLRSILSPDGFQIDTEYDNLEQCSICFNTMGQSDCPIFPSIQIACGHTFHFECIAGYVENKLSTYPWVRCPNCRNKISEDWCNRLLSSSNLTRNESLLEAVKQSNYEVTYLLLSCEADPNYFDPNTKITPLHCAAHNMSNGSSRQDILDKICMRLIQHGAKVNAMDSIRKRARDYISSHNESLTVLVEAGGIRSGYYDHPKTAFGLPVRKDK